MQWQKRNWSREKRQKKERKSEKCLLVFTYVICLCSLAFCFPQGQGFLTTKYCLSQQKEEKTEVACSDPQETGHCLLITNHKVPLK